MLKRTSYLETIVYPGKEAYRVHKKVEALPIADVPAVLRRFGNS